jgi:hypothetical protein
MGVEQQILTNLSKLPIDQQQEVLDLVAGLVESGDQQKYASLKQREALADLLWLSQTVESRRGERSWTREELYER